MDEKQKHQKNVELKRFIDEHRAFRHVFGEGNRELTTLRLFGMYVRHEKRKNPDMSLPASYTDTARGINDRNFIRFLEENEERLSRGEVERAKEDMRAIANRHDVRGRDNVLHQFAKIIDEAGITDVLMQSDNPQMIVNAYREALSDAGVSEKEPRESEAAEKAAPGKAAPSTKREDADRVRTGEAPPAGGAPGIGLGIFGRDEEGKTEIEIEDEEDIEERIEEAIVPPPTEKAEEEKEGEEERQVEGLYDVPLEEEDKILKSEETPETSKVPEGTEETKEAERIRGIVRVMPQEQAGGPATRMVRRSPQIGEEEETEEEMTPEQIAQREQQRQQQLQQQQQEEQMRDYRRRQAESEKESGGSAAPRKKKKSPYKRFAYLTGGTVGAALGASTVSAATHAATHAAAPENAELINLLLKIIT